MTDRGAQKHTVSLILTPKYPIVAGEIHQTKQTGVSQLAKRVIDIQSSEEAEILKATRERIRALRASQKKDADKLSAGEFSQLLQIKTAINELLKAAVAEGKIDKAWNLKRLSQVGNKEPKNWPVKRRTILGLVKKRKKNSGEGRSGA